MTVGDYYPEDAELPPDLSESRVGDPDAASLEASREEMLTYIAGLRARRRRRRLRALGMSMMIVAAIGAGILIGTGSYSSGPEERRPDVPRDAWVAAGNPSAAGRGVPSNNQTGAVAELAAGQKTIVGSTYLDQAGDVCSKVADVVKGVTKAYGVGCTPAAQIAHEFSRGPAVLNGSSVGRRHILLFGFARKDVRTVLVRRPSGHSDVAISGRWISPSRAPYGAIALKTLLIRVQFKSGPKLEEGIRAQRQPGVLEFAAVLDDGRVLRISGE